MATARGSYHHGDLGAALVDAGVALAREAGASAVVLREVTRRVGVTPRAAYRHVADRDAHADDRDEQQHERDVQHAADRQED
ncbi:TetR family transcriptional regulator, partial [Cellulomonas sp. 179-A 9B4 NHS]|uniref:TetR family transcriptional regulator n=1 Tax=Cellulomonas sp. 179-A 9B4 NHS TaxID=3142379 RepID=UPI00399FF451